MGNFASALSKRSLGLACVVASSGFIALALALALAVGACGDDADAPPVLAGEDAGAGEAAAPEACSADAGQTTCGVGLCARTVDNCVDGSPQACVPGTPLVETCNGEDDDCDGQTDEDLGQTTCGVGACARTVESCVGGVLQTCTQGDAGAEICDGVDNDCNGQIDDNLPPAATTFSPVLVTGFTIDAIAEVSPAASSTTGSLDGSNYVIYSAAYRAPGGLPNTGTLVNGSRTYQLSPYDQANTLRLLQNEVGSLTVTTPGSYDTVSLLGFATEGAGALNVTLEYADGTSDAFTNVSLRDWSSSTGAVVSGVGRTGRADDVGSGGQRMFPIDLRVPCDNKIKLLTKVTVVNVTTNPNTRVCIVAVSAG